MRGPAVSGVAWPDGIGWRMESVLERDGGTRHALQVGHPIKGQPIAARRQFTPTLPHPWAARTSNKTGSGVRACFHNHSQVGTSPTCWQLMVAFVRRWPSHPRTCHPIECKTAARARTSEKRLCDTITCHRKSRREKQSKMQNASFAPPLRPLSLFSDPTVMCESSRWRGQTQHPATRPARQASGLQPCGGQGNRQRTRRVCGPRNWRCTVQYTPYTQCSTALGGI